MRALAARGAAIRYAELNQQVQQLLTWFPELGRLRDVTGDKPMATAHERAPKPKKSRAWTPARRRKFMATIRRKRNE